MPLPARSFDYEDIRCVASSGRRPASAHVRAGRARGSLLRHDRFKRRRPRRPNWIGLCPNQRKCRFARGVLVRPSAPECTRTTTGGTPGQGPRPFSEGVDTSTSVQIVRFPGRIGALDDLDVAEMWPPSWTRSCDLAERDRADRPRPTISDAQARSAPRCRRDPRAGPLPASS
jgi:hypothetical protein